jgi:hypothetical protein
MGKNTLVTRLGVRYHDSRDGGARQWSRLFWLPGSDAKARTLSGATMSKGKNVLVANRSRCHVSQTPPAERVA